MSRSTETGFQIRRLGYALGAEVTGLDLAGKLTDAQYGLIEAAVLEHQMLCFRDQHLDDSQIVAFSQHFGTPIDNSYVKHVHPTNPLIQMLTNKPYEGKPSEDYKNGDYWHTDRSYEPNPTSYTFLYAAEMPDVGGNTMYSNQYMSYEALSPALQQFVNELSTIQVESRTVSTVVDQHPPAVQPLVRIHPDTGRRSLYLGGNAVSILGLTVEESQPLLNYLMSHSTRPEFTYRHAWRPHDFIMWDNRCTMHIGVSDYDKRTGAPPRHLLKCSLYGETVGRLHSGGDTFAPAASHA